MASTWSVHRHQLWQHISIWGCVGVGEDARPAGRDGGGKKNICMNLHINQLVSLHTFYIYSNIYTQAIYMYRHWEHTHTLIWNVGMLLDLTCYWFSVWARVSLFICANSLTQRQTHTNAIVIMRFFCVFLLCVSTHFMRACVRPHRMMGLWRCRVCGLCTAHIKQVERRMMFCCSFLWLSVRCGDCSWYGGGDCSVDCGFRIVLSWCFLACRWVLWSFGSYMRAMWCFLRRGASRQAEQKTHIRHTHVRECVWRMWRGVGEGDVWWHENRFAKRIVYR